MLYMLINKTRKDLTAEQYQELGKLAQGFYDNVPEGITLHGDWSAIDQSCTFALMESDDPQLLEQIQQPFKGFVDIDVIPVNAVSGWGK